MVVSGNLTNEEIDDILSQEYIGRIGCHDNGKTYVVPVTYGYDRLNGSIVGVMGEGMKVDMIRKNPLLCFEVEKIKNISNWKTVIAWGNFEELQGADARNAIHTLVTGVRELLHVDKEEKHPPFLRDISSPNSDSFIVYRIKLIEKSGKFERT